MNKKAQLTCFLLIFLTTLNAQKLSVRSVEKLNSEWKFMLADSTGFSAEDYNHNHWRSLDIPHDWSIEHDFNKKNDGRNAWLPGGVAWYRKNFRLLPEDLGKHVRIVFDGVYLHSKVWVNGVYLGAHYDGYTSFYYDLTNVLHPNKLNTIAVRVDNSAQTNCRWYSGSGIYRDVTLIKTNPLHITQWGTQIAMPSVNTSEAEVKLKSTFENYTGEDKVVDIETTVYSSDGSKVGFKKEKKISIKNQARRTVTNDLVIRNPYPWSLQNPHLYTAVTEIKVGNKVIDDYITKFGVRALSFDAEKGFFLNSENIKIKGVCLHHDAGPLGTAVPKKVWEYRLKQLKSIGCNAIRTAHNPPSTDLLDLCDSLGIMVLNELVDKWVDEKWAEPHFELEWKQNFANTIRRDRNRPSVIMWSVGNENFSPEDIRQTVHLKKYTTFVKAYDNSRPVISGMERGKDMEINTKVDAIIQSAKYMDVIALNYGEQWSKMILDAKPGKPFISTESYTYFSSTPELRFANVERSPWFDVEDNPANMGLFLWVGIDYLGEVKTYPNIGSDSGLLDVAGNLKNRAYFYKSLWTKKPMIQMYVYEGDANDFSTSGKWGWPPMNQNWNHVKKEQFDLVTYSNCDEVDLYVNRKKIGTQVMVKSLNHVMKWLDVPYKDGQVKAIGKINGEEVCEIVLHTAEKPVKLKVTSNKKKTEPGDILFLQVEAVDEQGLLNPLYGDILHFELEGGGEILGISNGNMHMTPLYIDKTRTTAYHGKTTVIVKVGEEPNALKFTATAIGLEDGVLEFTEKLLLVDTE